jgi:hypothetical protein
MRQPPACGCRPSDPAAVTGAACVAVIAGWALIAAAGSVHRFLWSTQAIQNPGDGLALWGPAWVQTAGYLVALVGLIWGGVLIVLLVMGVYHLGRAVRATARWVIAWAVAAMAGMALEVEYVFGPALTKSYPGYVAEHATMCPEFPCWRPGFLVVGAAMLAILRAAGPAAAP